MANFSKIYEYGCLITPDVKVIRISDDEQHNDHLTKNYRMNLKQALNSGWIRYRDEEGLFDAWWGDNVSDQSIQRLIDIVMDSGMQKFEFAVGRKIYEFDNKQAAITFLQNQIHHEVNYSGSKDPLLDPQWGQYSSF